MHLKVCIQLLQQLSFGIMFYFCKISREVKKSLINKYSKTITMRSYHSRSNIQEEEEHSSSDNEDVIEQAQKHSNWSHYVKPVTVPIEKNKIQPNKIIALIQSENGRKGNSDSEKITNS